MKLINLPAPREGQSVQCIQCSEMIPAEIALCDLRGVPFKAYYHPYCVPVCGLWEFIEERGGYFFWKYSTGETFVYNCTQNPKPPGNEAGYYSYGYLLKVKGLLKGVTLNSILQELGDKLT